MFLPEFSREQVDAEHGQSSEYRREELESNDIIAQEEQRERLQVDKEPFAPVVVGVEELVMTGFVRADGVDAVHRFVWIESGGEVSDIPESQEERHREQCCKNGCRRQILGGEKALE